MSACGDESNSGCIRVPTSSFLRMDAHVQNAKHLQDSKMRAEVQNQKELPAWAYMEKAAAPALGSWERSTPPSVHSLLNEVFNKIGIPVIL